MRYDYIIAGAGIIGLSIARKLITREPHARIAIIEKESDVAKHASGRNSGVLHAGFYYTEDSLKARFTRDGNRAIKEYCEQNGLNINRCGKLVVASDESELHGLEVLKRRATRNGVRLEWLSEVEAANMDPNVRTYKKALYSPDTASVDPVEVCQCLKREIVSKGVDLFFDTKYIGRSHNTIRTNKTEFTCGYFINAAGLFADKIAHDFGFGLQYTIIPFKGIYLKYAKNKSDVATNIYPVPNLNNPFLGVHFTKTVDGSIKIGPTAIPAFWRENYKGFQQFDLMEFIQIMYYEAKLFLTNSFQFRRLAFEEMKKYNKANFIDLSLKMVKKLDRKGFGDFLQPGIRAQLLNKNTLELVQDFVVEGDGDSIHVLNAVSPAFTCSFPFAEYVADLVEEKQLGKPAIEKLLENRARK
ncbi:L-2-hydroxyglutarate oxidase [Paenibacillus mesophilus]|uniref:L-2-hydroxyglutarate oxidase n=1 Tax=Paenibacillus mesophilus TaxID=2582849 RepID=UPI00110DBDCB|nr:L-2-hydroxyglutarate oxidase [Paenibacillus mesophilus]TMV48597.1 L-2-hydroxyglutarate oxidase [Paenibacillus mesophilus]